MKKLIRLYTACVLSLLLFSCQRSSEATLMQETPLPSTTTPSLLVPGTHAMTTSTPNMITPEIGTADINFVSELSGSLFIGSYESGTYVELDFDEDRVLYYQFPQHCKLVTIHLKAVCEVDFVSDKAGIYIFDVLTGQRAFTEIRDVGRWDVTSSDELLVYTLAGPDEIGVLINAYDFITNKSNIAGTFDSKEMTLSIPWLSNSAKSMIGVNYETLSRDYDDEWYMMYADTMQAEPIIVPDNIAATDSIEWSPNDALVALIGFYRDDENPHPGTLRCKKEVLIYDPVAQNIKSTVKVPENRCYTPIDFYQEGVWSPDSSKIALVLDQQDICIVYVSKGGLDCVPISNNDETEYKIRSLAWSPDSNYLVFNGSDGKIQVYSVKDDKTFIITDAGNLSPSPIGSDLIWGP